MSALSWEIDFNLETYRLRNQKRGVAEGEGFEPPEPFPVQRFSRPPH